MSEPSEEDEIKAWRALLALRHVSDAEPTSPDELTALLEREFLMPLTRDFGEKPDSLQRQGILIRLLNRRSSAIEDVLAYLMRTGQFKEKEIKDMRRVKFFKELVAGRVQVRPSYLSLERGVGYLCVISMVSGVLVGLVMAADAVGIPKIIQMYGLGLALGSIAGRVIGETFGYQRLVKKVFNIAPHLVPAEVLVH